MLKRVSIQNFKSLKDVTLDLQKVNLLIGPNNSGKTNFLKALEFFGKNSSVISYEPNRNKIAYRHSTTDIINLQFKFELQNRDSDFRNYTYHVYECEIPRNASVLKTNWKQDLEEPSIKTFEANDKLFDSIGFVKKVGSLSIYRPNYDTITKPAPAYEGTETVNPDAANLAGFLDLMMRNYRKTIFNRIETDLHTCIPEFDEIKVEKINTTDELKKQFGDKTFIHFGLTDNKQGITYWADELSEGTLYFLALLCIINQPNPPKLLLLEEPERGIHPRRIREVMDFIFRLAEEKDVQIILTSHNEHVLDDFATRPEAVFVFDKDEEGATYVRNLQTDIIEPTNQRNRELGLDEIDLTTNLSENWLYGLLGGVPSIP